MNPTLQPSGNAVLVRELRASLRNARPFALIALYVAVLGAIVVSNFPYSREITVEQGGGRLGKDLYWTFVIAQAMLIFIVLPALASGALAQEREQRTLEPLLLTPLTPLQIVWGKAVGVLSIAGLLLVSTLPLTSLCFLLGGVSPGELVAAYIVLIGLALFTASVGLYCSAKWPNTVHATLWCYGLLPFFLLFLALFSGIGVIVAALAILGFILHLVARVWNHWGRRPVGETSTPVAERFGSWWSLFGWVAVLVTSIFLLYVLATDSNMSSIAVGAFAVAYLIFISQIALQQAAREIVRAPEPSGPARQKMEDFQSEWRQAVTAPTYLPDPTAIQRIDVAPPSQPQTPASTPVAADVVLSQRVVKDTYNEAQFLSDKLNPIYAKDLRSGLLGKFQYLLRFSYIAVIGSELLLILLALVAPAQPLSQEWMWFSALATMHLIALLVAGAWLGARSIAPEHEQQTLAQLIMTPLTAGQIVSGKIQAVMTYTFYVFMLGLPLAILLAAVKVVTWRAALAFIGIEIVFGAVAAAWGMYCSLKAVSTRRALGIALGGVFIIICAGYLFDNTVQQGFKLLIGRELISPQLGAVLTALLSPLRLLGEVLNPSAFIATVPVAGASTQAQQVVPVFAIWLLSLCVWSVIAMVLLFLTKRGFQHYADTV